MSNRMPIACPNCRHELRVRPEYVGQTVTCNYCHLPFVVRAPESPAPATPARPPGQPRGETARRSPAVMTAEIEWARGKITRLRAQRQALARELLDAKNELAPLQVRAMDLQGQLEQARLEASHAQEESRRLAGAQSELDRLRAEAAALGMRAADADSLEEQLRRAVDDHEGLRVELEEARARLSMIPEPPVEESGSGPAVGDSEEIARLVDERDRADSERARLEQELESLRAGFKAARDEINRLGQGLEETAAESARLEEELQAVSRMRAELQSLLGARERALAEREAELSDGRRQLDSERAELEQGLGHENRKLAADLAEAAARIAALEHERDEADRARGSAVQELDALGARDRAGSARLHDLASQLEAARRDLESLRGEQYVNRTVIGELQARAARAEEERAGQIGRLAASLAESQAQLEQKGRQVAEMARRMRSIQDESLPATQARELPPRPRAGPDADPAGLRTALEAWLGQAQDELSAIAARAEALGGEVKAARNELGLLHRDLALGDWDEEEIAFPFEEG